MEIILEIMQTLPPLIVTAINFCLFLKMKEAEKVLHHINSLVENQCTDLYESNAKTNCRLTEISEKIDRSTLSLRKILEPTEPINKPNNWDSIREAFKGPTRIEVNERD